MGTKVELYRFQSGRLLKEPTNWIIICIFTYLKNLHSQNHKIRVVIPLVSLGSSMDRTDQKRYSVSAPILRWFHRHQGHQARLN